MLKKLETTTTQDSQNPLNITLPTGKFEYTDGNANYFLATENFVFNTLSIDIPCHVATTANLLAIYDNGAGGFESTLTNSGTQAAFSVDGVTPTLGQRVLVKNQNTDNHNGLYTVTNTGSISTNWVLTRDNEFRKTLKQGLIIPIIEGTLNVATLWMLTSYVVLIGTSPMIFTRVLKDQFDTIEGTANEINVSIVNGVATLSIASNPVFPGTGGATMPGGTLAQRPTTLVAGTLRYNNGS